MDDCTATMAEKAAGWASGMLSMEDMLRMAQPQDPPGEPDGTLRSISDDEIAGVPVRISSVA